MGLDLGKDFQRLHGRCLEEVGGGSTASPLGRGAPISSVLGGWTAQTKSRRLDATTRGGMQFQSFGVGSGPPGRRHQDGIRHSHGRRGTGEGPKMEEWMGRWGRKEGCVGRALNDHTPCSSERATDLEPQLPREEPPIPQGPAALGPRPSSRGWEQPGEGWARHKSCSRPGGAAQGGDLSHACPQAPTGDPGTTGRCTSVIRGSLPESVALVVPVNFRPTAVLILSFP